MKSEQIAEIADATAAFNGSVLMALVNMLASCGAVDDSFVEHVDALIETCFMKANPGTPELQARGLDFRKMLRHQSLPLAYFKGESD